MGTIQIVLKVWVIDFNGTAEINLIFLMIPHQTSEVLVTGIKGFHDEWFIFTISCNLYEYQDILMQILAFEQTLMQSEIGFSFCINLM